MQHMEELGSGICDLIAVESMIYLFAAIGHIHYAKTSRLYQQLMLDQMIILGCTNALQNRSSQK